jgi:hypothetical protein
LDAFNSTWNRARATFGDGTPVRGGVFDKSSQLRGMQSTVRSAAPDPQWTGEAADQYAEANSGYARKFGRMATLDQHLRAEVSRSADVVWDGRRDLDVVRQWVNDASARLPRSAAGERMLWTIVSQGNAAITEIVRRSHGEMTSIAARLDGVGEGWDELGEADAG